MRKAYFFFFLLLCAVTVHAQKTRSYTSGLKAGLNLYELKFDPSTEGISSDMRTSFNAGIFFNVPFSSCFSVQPELLYSGQGGKFEGKDYKSELALTYVSIPVLFQYNTKIGFYVEAGPSLNVLAKGKETTTNNSVTSELDLKKRVKKAGFSVMGGLGYKMKNIGINARYDYGISNSAKVDTEPEIKSTGIQVGLSWAFKQQ